MWPPYEYLTLLLKVAPPAVPLLPSSLYTLFVKQMCSWKIEIVQKLSEFVNHNKNWINKNKKCHRNV